MTISTRKVKIAKAELIRQDDSASIRDLEHGQGWNIKDGQLIVTVDEHHSYRFTLQNTDIIERE